MQFIQEIKLDVGSTQYSPCINAKQKDNAARYILATITENGRQLMPDAGAVAMLRVQKKDGHYVDKLATILSDGRVMAELTDQMLACPGLAMADIVLTKDREVLSTVTFSIDVSKVPTGDYIESVDDFLAMADATQIALAAAERALSNSVLSVNGKTGDVNLQIGGVQILRGTNTVTTLTSAGEWADGTWRAASEGTGARQAIAVTDAPNPAIKTGWSLSRTAGSVDISQGSVPVQNGVTYTLSCYARGTGALRLQYGKSPYRNRTITLSGVAAWTRYSYTFTVGAASDGSANGSTNIYLGNMGNGTIEICGMKLEQGDMATDWNYAEGEADWLYVGTRNLVLDSGKEKTGVSGAASNMGPSWNLSDYGKAVLAKPGTELCISYDAKSTVAGQRLSMNLRADEPSMHATTPSQYVTLTEEYQRYSFKTSILDSAEGVAARAWVVVLAQPDDTAATVSIKNVDVKLGHVYTDYTAAPEDMEARIAALEKKLAITADLLPGEVLFGEGPMEEEGAQEAVQTPDLLPGDVLFAEEPDQAAAQTPDVAPDAEESEEEEVAQAAAQTPDVALDAEEATEE